MSTRQLSNKTKYNLTYREVENTCTDIWNQYPYDNDQQKSKIQKVNPIKRTLAVLLYSAWRSVMCLDLCHF
jgi:hypothetical protein